MARSVRASVDGLKKAQSTFKLKAWTQDHLAGRVKCQRGVVINFFAGRNVALPLFQEICTELGLEWGEIAELEESVQRSIPNHDFDVLIQEVRNKVSASIQKRCGIMRVLDMSQPITIDSIYTSVNILEKISRNQRCSIEDLLEGCEVENFNRFILGAVRQGQERIPALEAVKDHEKLMILGKPGAGKTTFLKWLTLQCNEGRVHANRVPFFITLKEFAEMDGQPDLLGFVAKQLTDCGVEYGEEVGARILYAGRSIMLLDGLDEVRSQDHDRIINTIRYTSEQFNGNQFVMTCRIAAKEYVFEQFTEVEVADFDDRQIADFAYKWFQQKDPIKVEGFSKELKANLGLKELATNPLLLTLLCLVFGESGRFPVNRSELYKEGLDILLKKWDAKRNIKREEVYKQLSLQRKENLLSQVAYKAFEQNDYFFKKKLVEEQIRDYIRNLPNAATDLETLQLDSEAILNSIAAQHGLLVERARGIYSFSHLTFQEYFTARWFKEKADGDFSELISHIGDIQWREVFLLTVGMLKNADLLLKEMKREIDGLLAKDENLQRFLDWVEKKSCSIISHYKPVAVRAFYLDLARDHALDRSLASALPGALDPFLASALDPFLASALDFDLDFARSRTLNRLLAFDLDLARAGALAGALARSLALDFFLALDLSRTLDLVLARACALTLEIESTDLHQLLQQLKGRLPDLSSDNNNNFKNWWNANGREWSEKLRAIMIQHRNIGHDWQFSEDQKKNSSYTMMRISCC
jgi:predicted NACHT family NTPase